MMRAPGRRWSDSRTGRAAERPAAAWATLAHLRDDLDRVERVAAELEEIVVDADALQAEHRGPDRRQALLDRVARREVGRRPARACARCAGAGSARRSSLPLAVSGIASSDTNADGHHVVGQLLLEEAGQLAVRARSPSACGHDIGDQPLSPGVSSRATTTASATAGCSAQHALDLAELDAVAADLDLVVEPAEEDQRAVRPAARLVAGAVQACAGPLAERIGDELSAVSSGSLA